MPAHGGEESLYLRPFMIATEVGLGVKPANEYLFLVIASPAGAYFPGGVQARLHLALRGPRPRRPRRHGRRQDRRQLRGLPARPGRGRRARLRPGLLPRRRRAQVDRGTRRHEPVLRVRGPRSSPPPSPAPSWTASPATPSSPSPATSATTAEEGRVSVDQWQRDAENGTLTEVFACGTAAVITPVGTVKRAGGEWTAGRRRARRGHAAAARGAARHPAGYGRGHARLDARSRLRAWRGRGAWVFGARGSGA